MRLKRARRAPKKDMFVNYELGGEGLYMERLDVDSNRIPHWIVLTSCWVVVVTSTSTRRAHTASQAWG